MKRGWFLSLACCLSFACLLVLSIPTAHAVGTTETGPSPAAKLEASLRYESGKVSVGSGVADLTLGPQFRFLNPDEAQKVLVEGWGNPPGGKTLGMIVPAAVSPLSDEGWGVIITYEEEGYVDDKGAEKIDYDDLLKDMKKSVSEENGERKKEGYEPIQLVGWAEAPRYDKSSHKLYWAKELQFGASQPNTLNYNVRVLGRRGVLVLNAVAGMNQLGQIRGSVQQLLPMVEFNAGHRYADYIPGKDKLAKYGIGALIAGGLAAKAGLFKVLFAGLLAAKKLVIVGVAAAAAGVKKFFGNKADDRVTTVPPPPPPPTSTPIG